MRVEERGARPPTEPAATSQISTHDGTDEGHHSASIPIIERDLDAVAVWLDELRLAAPGSAPVPLFGTGEWVAADEPTRLASLARWALLQLAEESPAVLGARLAAEIEIRRREYAEAMKQASLDVVAELRRERELIRRRKNEIGDALRRGDADRAYALTVHHGSNQWAEEPPAGTTPVESGSRP